MVNSRRSVNLPAPCFNQYNVPVLRSPAQSVRSDFARFVAHKFGHGPFLVIGPERAELERQFEEAGVKATVLRFPGRVGLSGSAERQRPAV